ncbi:uncharacterized protein [Montipora foliosa]|uniref:uncharacterized protein n=1 Tax=Montipora foliosa TaxID=591990 RepID=UPI0035F2007B
MRKNFKISLVISFLFWFLTSVIHEGASRKHSPGCVIVGKLSDCPKDEETVDPESHPPFDCSMKRGGTIKKNTTWKQVVSEVRHKECLVLKTANSEKRIYLASALVIASRSGSPKYIYQNQGIDIYCNFKGRPRPQITWYKNNKPITNESESLHHKELEKSRDNGILITSSTLHVPGREEFEALYMCAANSRLSNEWSTFQNFTIEVLFNCNQDTTIRANTPLEIQESAFNNITLSCLVKWDASYTCQRFAWHFINNPESLKTNEKYRIVVESDSLCYDAYKLEITNVTGKDEGEYSCHQSCEDNVKGWLNSSVKFQLKVLSEISTINEVNGNTTSAAIFESTPGVAGYSTNPKDLEDWIIPVVTSVAGVFILALAVTWYFKKMRTCKKVKRCADERVQNDKLFISYSSKDFSWVTENLISLFEKHSVPYSIHIRDFELGRPIVQNMADSVYNSRQVVIVLSNNYLASNFCREELHMALQRGVDTGDSALVLVAINKLKKKQLPSALREKNLLDFEKHRKKQDWEKKLVDIVQGGKPGNI